jgi:hypothetical protein
MALRPPEDRHVWPDQINLSQTEGSGEGPQASSRIEADKRGNKIWRAIPRVGRWESNLSGRNEWWPALDRSNSLWDRDGSRGTPKSPNTMAWPLSEMMSFTCG